MHSRNSGVRINGLPKFLSEDPDKKTYAIIVDDLMNPNEPLIIPLVLKGVTSYLLLKKPIVGDYED